MHGGSQVEEGSRVTQGRSRRPRRIVRAVGAGTTAGHEGKGTQVLAGRRNCGQGRTRRREPSISFSSSLIRERYLSGSAGNWKICWIMWFAFRSSDPIVTCSGRASQPGFARRCAYGRAPCNGSHRQAASCSGCSRAVHLRAPKQSSALSCGGIVRHLPAAHQPLW